MWSVIGTGKQLGQLWQVQCVQYVVTCVTGFGCLLAGWCMVVGMCLVWNIAWKQGGTTWQVHQSSCARCCTASWPWWPHDHSHMISLWQEWTDPTGDYLPHETDPTGRVNHNTQKHTGFGPHSSLGLLGDPASHDLASAKNGSLHVHFKMHLHDASCCTVPRC